jgi:hypothetical protein
VVAVQPIVIKTAVRFERAISKAQNRLTLTRIEIPVANENSFSVLSDKPLNGSIYAPIPNFHTKADNGSGSIAP